MSCLRRECPARAANATWGVFVSRRQRRRTDPLRCRRRVCARITDSGAGFCLGARRLCSGSLAALSCQGWVANLNQPRSQESATSAEPAVANKARLSRRGRSEDLGHLAGKMPGVECVRVWKLTESSAVFVQLTTFPFPSVANEKTSAPYGGINGFGEVPCIFPFHLNTYFFRDK